MRKKGYVTHPLEIVAVWLRYQPQLSVVETKWLDNGMNQCLIFEKILILVFHIHNDDFIYGSKSATGPPNMGSFDGEES